MAIPFKTAVKRAKKLYKSGRYKKFSDAVKAAYKKSGGPSQTGKRVSVSKDRKRKAKAPGRRKTARGTTYTETRRNRSDRKGAVTGLRVTPLALAKSRLANACLAYELANTISATKKAAKKRVQYRKEIKGLLK